MKMDNVKLLAPHEFLHRRIKRHIEGQSHPRSVAGNRHRAPDTIEAVTDFDSTPARSRGDNNHLVPETSELRPQMIDVLRNPAWMAKVVRRNLSDFHAEPNLPAPAFRHLPHQNVASGPMITDPLRMTERR